MADNVNIIVQDTINDIVVNAAVVVETIDINVQAAVDVVDIVANPNNYVVNINRIIGEQVQSDWDQNDNQAPDYIKNKPTIPAAQVNSDWDATTGVAEILNKPTIPTATSDLTNDGSDGVNPFITAADIPPVTGFVPYTGATANVDLGEYELKAGQVTLDTSPTGTAAVATTRWNNTIGSTETTLKGGSVLLKNGVDLVARVVNKVTPNTTLTKAAYQAVRISGAQGQRLAVAYAQANNDNNSADTIGIVCETIATNQEGFILTVGQLEEINTTGSLQGETWADGDVLYLSPTTAGRLTNIKPTGATGHIVVMGYVEYAHAIHGKIYVKIMNGWELDELHNVFINSPANNQGLFYDSSDSLWKNETIASALGYTPQQELVSGTNIKTINGNSVLGSGDLVVSGSSSLAIGTTPITSGTIGRVLFQGTGNVLQQSANLFWDNTNNRLGIGTATPTQALDILGTNVVVSKIRSSTNTGATIFQGFNDLNNSCEYGIIGSTRAGTGALASGNAYLYGGVDLAVTSLTNIKFGVGSILNERMRIFGATGNIVIQSGGTITDAGFRLDVNGTARVQGQMTLSATGNSLNIPSTGRIFFANREVSIGDSVTAGFEAVAIGSLLTSATAGNILIGKNLNSSTFTNVIMLASRSGLLTATSSLTLNIGSSNTAGVAIFGSTSGSANSTEIAIYGSATGAGIEGNIAIGRNTSATGQLAIALGAFAEAAANEFVVGSRAKAVTNVYFGSGNQSLSRGAGTGASYTINGSGAFGTDFAGGNLTIAGGKGTGTGTSGDVIFSTATPTTTGTTLQTLTQRWFIKGSSGILANVSTPNASAQLQVDSTTQGFLPPRMTTTQKNAIATPAAGLMVYDTTLNLISVYNGTMWISL